MSYFCDIFSLVNLSWPLIEGVVECIPIHINPNTNNVLLSPFTSDEVKVALLVCRLQKRLGKLRCWLVFTINFR